MDEPLIQIQGLHKHFGDVRAVDGIDLRVSSGEVYGMLGPNGAGKTTCIRALLGYLNPTEGSARVLGGDARSLSIRRRVGYLPGDLRLEPTAHVRSLLSWFADLRGGVPEDRVDALCERLHLDPDRRFGELSKGNRQKVGVVQAFMHDPDVLVLDEPTSGLDPLMQREVVDLVRERQREGSAVLFSSHIIFEVEEVADRVGILRSGRLVVEDSVAGLQEVTARQSMHVRFGREVGSSDFDGVELVSVQTDGSTADVVVKGAIAPLLQRLADLGAVHLSTDPLVLDDVFYGAFDQADGPDRADRAAGPDRSDPGTEQR
jgi:ABC-2 type transport system ATP-binding protein